MEKTLARAADLSPEEHRILAEGRVRLHKWGNCAPGAYGAAVHGLVRRDLMTADWQENPQVLLDHDREWSVYTVTRAGRDAYVSYGRPYVPTSLDEKNA